jgi:AhpD family alkylhydroperoxidase
MAGERPGLIELRPAQLPRTAVHQCGSLIDTVREELEMGTTGLDQLVVRMLEAACRRMWGFPPRMIPFIVGRMGAVRAVAWFARNMPRYLSTLRVLGPVRTHLACVTISLRNGCTYCAYGHAYALELFHLRDHGRLFPTSAAEMADWIGLDGRELRDRLRALLQQAGLHVEALWVDRTLDLMDGAGPMDAAEARIAHLVRMVGTMNGIATDNHVAPDEAQSPINKDVALKARYTTLRAGVA